MAFISHLDNDISPIVLMTLLQDWQEAASLLAIKARQTSSMNSRSQLRSHLETYAFSPNHNASSQNLLSRRNFCR